MRKRVWWVAASVLLASFVPATGLGRDDASHFILQSGRGLGVAMAFSPDGKTLATAGGNVIAFIDVETKRHRASLSGVYGYVRTLSFSPDGRVLVTGCGPFLGSDETSALQIWDVTSMAELRSLGVEQAVMGVAFTESGDRLVSAHEDATVRTWDWRRGELLSVTTHPTGEFIGGVALSPDGSKLAVVSGDPYRSWWDYVEGKLYDATSETVLREFDPPHTNLQPELRFSENGRWLITDDRVTDLERAESEPELISPWGTVLGIDSAGIAFVNERDEDGRSLEQWDLVTGTKQRSVSFSSDWPTSVALSNSAHSMAVRLARGGASRIAFYDRKGLEAVGDVTGPAVPPAGQTGGNGPLEIAAFTPEGSELVTADAFGTIRFWDTGEWVETKRMETECSSITALRLASLGGALATRCNVGGYVQLWNVDERREVARIGGYPAAFEFTLDGKELAWLDGFGTSRLRFVEVATGKEARSLWLPADELRFSSDGQHIVGLLVESNAPMAGAMLRLAVWDAKSGEERWHVAEGGAFAVSPSGRRIATSSHLYDVATGETLLRYNQREGFLQSIAFSADGRWLATGWEPLRGSGDERSIVIWNTETWEEVAALSGHDAPIGHVRFSPDTRQLVSVSHDSTLRIWSLKDVLR